MALETQTVTIVSDTVYDNEASMVLETSDVLIQSPDVDDVAMYNLVYETLEATMSRSFSNGNTITAEKTYDGDLYGTQIRELYDAAQTAWEAAGFTVTITYS